jgi:phosphate transport system substrate-binding protein
MFRAFRAVLGAALLFVIASIGAQAQDVELRSLDGAVELEGTLLAFDGAYYQLDTIYGPLTVAAEGVSCVGPGCPDLTTFVAEARIAGATTVAEGLLPALLDGFAASQGLRLGGPTLSSGGLVYALTRRDGTLAAQFIVTPGSTDSGFLALLNRDADMSLALRTPTEPERRAARADAPNDPPLSRRVRVLALDALVPVVAPQNPVAAISLPDLARAFAGDVDNWQALGGPDAPIALHLLDPGLGLTQAFTAQVLFASDLLPEGDITRHATAASLAQAVARDAYAIGITANSVRGATQALDLQGSCGFTQGADVAAVRSEDYPLTAPVYLYLAPQRLPQLVRQFLAFTETAAAERIVAEAGYVNQSLTRTDFAMQGVRLANAIATAGGEVDLVDLQEMVAVLSGAERLSATFRFAEGSTDLDPQSSAAAARLAAAIERGVFDGRRLLFVGFSDGAGRAEVNERLSLRRAETVRNAVAAQAAGDLSRVEIESIAFGEAMPMSCDETEWGRSVNRRVEVWVR